jgi:diguanylate cyclase (GGDEF)-like protein
MISLKRYLDQRPDKLPLVGRDAYLATLKAIADGAIRCCPPTGEALQHELSLASEPLKNGRAEGAFKSAHQKVLNSLRTWGDQSEAYFTRKTAEVKEILTELAGTAESIGKRDQRYAQQFDEITANLRSIAKLDDISRIRVSLLCSASELKGCVERMAREGSDSIAQLETSLACHRHELEQARELATLDQLTGLYNRREMEVRIQRKLTESTVFCVAIVSLYNFKQINEKHGHVAGDEVLRQITHELRMASRAQDILGRWGSDEFVLVVDGNFTNTKIKMQRMRPWVFGTYELDLAGTMVNVVVSASIGMAEWAPGETLRQILSRVEADMDRDMIARC